MIKREERLARFRLMWSNISSHSRIGSSDSVGLEQQRVKSQEQTSEAEGCCLSKEEQNGAEFFTRDGSKLGSPLMRYKHAVCSASSGYIYIHGGKCGNSTVDDDVWRFDPHQNSWLRLETYGTKPPSLQEHTLVEYNERLYLFGGQVSASMSENSFWQLDLVSKEWRSLSMTSSKLGAHLGPANRRDHSAIVYGDSMYVYGGFEDFRGSSGQLWEFHLLKERWELRDLSATSACKPEPRHSHSAVVNEHSMYIYGGLSNLKPLSDLWRWSWKEKRWFKERTRGRSPGQLHGHSAIAAFGSMFVFGGERADGRATRGLWRLNLSNLSWTKIRPKGPKPSASTWHGAIANPLSILDEANYIIEGADLLPSSDAGSNQQSSSLAQLCPYRAPAENSQPLPQGQALLGTSISSGAINESFTGKRSNGDSSECKGGSSLLSLKKSTRLSFLQRKRRQERARSSYELKQLSSNKSSYASSRGALDNSKHMQLSSSSSSDARKLGDEASNVKILDSLDTDIKLMFEQALSPSCSTNATQSNNNVPQLEQEFISTSEGLPMSVDHSQIQSRLQTNLTSSSHYESARQDRSSATLKTCQNHDDELMNSRRTSYAFATPPSEMNSTLGLAPQTKRQEWSVSAASAFQQSYDFRRTDNRPKSEIVHSLIERADARIKHLYTPYFGQSSATQGAKEKRYSFNEKTKRHTLPQTMTYYNLFFDEENLVEEQQQLKLNSKQTELKSVQRLEQENTTTPSSSTGAVLTRIYSGAGSRTSQASEMSLDANSSDSRTLCGFEPAIADAVTTATTNSSTLSKSNIISPPVLSIPSALTSRREAIESCDDTSLSFSIIAEFEEDDILQYSNFMDDSIHNATENHYAKGHQPADDSSRKFCVEPQLCSLPDTTVRYKNSLDNQLTKESNEDSKLMGLIPSTSTNEAAVEFNEQTITNAHKSASSGYDSISGYENNLARTEQRVSETKQSNSRSSRQNSFGLEPLDIDMSRTGLCCSSTNETSLKQQNCIENSRCRPRQTIHNCATSSTTGDSLVFTSPSSSSILQCSSSIKNTTLIKSQIADQAQLSTKNTTSVQTQLKMPLRSKLFGRRKLKTRYWQLCMFVIGGKQGGSSAVNEPITMWRLYI